MFVYILASRTQRLYVDVTNDLIRRVYEHKTGTIPGFTRRYGINRLVYFESFSGPLQAIAREKQIKDYARAKKLAIVSSVNPDWNNLAELWFGDVTRNDPSLRVGMTREGSL